MAQAQKSDAENTASDIKRLMKDQAFVNGQWIGADNGAIFDVFNPATGDKIGAVPDMGAAETEKAVTAAAAAFETWKKTAPKERANILYKWYELIVDHADALAAIMTMEQGKPLPEAKAEVLGGAESVRWFAEEARRIYGDFIPTNNQNTRIVVEKQPVGVVGAITPWNFPSAMITRKVPPALAAGCTVVLKPAEDTPFSALALAVLGEEAGIPAGVFNIVTGSFDHAAKIGGALTSDARVRKISFTGSTAVGKLLMKQSADTVKKVSMELGGNAPVIIFDSADIDVAIKGVMAMKCRNAGQTCINANRIYVQDGIYDAFAAKLSKAFADIKVGHGDEDGTVIGPLINQKGVDKVVDLVGDAMDKGAKALQGGSKLDLGDFFYAPTVLTGMSNDMRITEEEIFGPVAALYRFKTEDEVVKAANDTPFGLASYFFSGDQAQCWRMAENLEAGMIGVNEVMIAQEIAPFGGVKESGIGREGSKYGVEEFCEIKCILFGNL
jgi:succinate-semialdehyde dehydrogenase/glutarate-semialdehyde dehydrogenase